MASHCGEGAVVGVVAGEQGRILDEHSHGFEDEGGEELDVDEIAGTAQPPGGQTVNNHETIVINFKQNMLFVQGLKK